jgi:HK97 gp10 family phage protein
MADTFTIRGLDGILDKLRKLPDRVANNAVRRSLRKGANVIRDAARNNAKRIDDPETRNRIWKNISVSSGGKKRERKAGGPMMRVGVRGGARFNRSANDLPGGNTTGYWRFVELGTSKMAAEPFLRPAGSEKA